MASLKKRGNLFYLQYYLPGKKQQRVNLHTDSYQIAKEKLRRFESAQMCGNDLPLPTRTPLPEILTAYVQHIRTIKTAKSSPDRHLLPPRDVRPGLRGGPGDQPETVPRRQETPTQTGTGSPLPTRGN